jgi:hypothetical protein
MAVTSVTRQASAAEGPACGRQCRARPSTHEESGALPTLHAEAAAQGRTYLDPGMKLITQVAIVCRDIEATSRWWAGVLAMRPFGCCMDDGLNAVFGC